DGYRTCDLLQLRAETKHAAAGKDGLGIRAMRGQGHTWNLLRASLAFSAIAVFLSLPQDSRAWGRNAHRLIINKAVDTLPADVRGFFEAGRGVLQQHVTDPLAPPA